jgi:hypothetical protein
MNRTRHPPISPRDLALAAARAARRNGTAPVSSPLASEPCPECHAPIALEDAWCRSCGSSRGVATSTPREDYLRACTAALELLRESHRRVRPLPETRRAEVDLEAAVGRLREGVEL